MTELNEQEMDHLITHWSIKTLLAQTNKNDQNEVVELPQWLQAVMS